MFHSLLFDIIVLHLIILVSIQVDGKRQKLHSFGNPEVILSNLKAILPRIYSIDEEAFTKYLDILVGSVMNKREAKVAKSSRRYDCLEEELEKIENMETFIELSRNKYRIINSYNENLCK
ncbi:unnamed protein product [Schistosoma mattheei]|uniref:Uncharacterized protein n=1 Tax=Schistosoma mattheei TaxID=31246 RepID=A0AA85BZD2_9TREM|nr:unnamed protein product [Schistosoma mattheei]